MYKTPTLMHKFQVNTVSNNWSTNIRGMFISSITSVDINYVRSELEFEIMNYADLVIQCCISDIVDDGLRQLTVNVENMDVQTAKEYVVAQKLVFNDLTAIHHSLRFRYGELAIAYHYLVLKYDSKELIHGR